MRGFWFGGFSLISTAPAMPGRLAAQRLFVNHSYPRNMGGPANVPPRMIALGRPKIAAALAFV